MSNEEKTSPKKERRLKRKKNRHRRRRLVGWMLLTFVVAAICFIYTPFESDYLDARVSAAWKQATGLEMEFDQATYDLADGRLNLAGVRIPTGAKSGEAICIDRVDINWRWILHDLSRFLKLERVDIYSPATLRARMEKGGNLVPVGDLRLYLDLLNNLPKRPREPGPEQHLNLTVALAGAGVQIDSATSDTLPIFALNDLALKLRLATSRRWELELRGRFPSAPTAAPLLLMVKPGTEQTAAFGTPGLQSAASPLLFALKCNALDLKKNLGISLPLNATGTDLRFDGTVTPLPDWSTVRLAANWSSGDLQVATSSTAQAVFVPSSTLQLQALMDFDKHMISVDRAQVDALGAKAAFSGQLEIGNNWAYVCDVQDAKFPVDVLNLVRRFLPETNSWDTTFTQGQIFSTLHLEGDRTGPDWDSLQASLRTEDLRGIPSVVGIEVGPVVAEAEYSSQSLRVVKFDAQLPPGRLTIFSAELKRFGQEWLEGVQASANWTVDFEADKLFEFLRRIRVQLPETMQGSGKVAGYGSLRGPWVPPIGSKEDSFAKALLASLETVELDGVVRWNNGSLDYDMLPAPVSGLSGSMTLDRKSVFFKDLEGSMLGSRTTITCTLSGAGQVWKNPSLDLNVLCSINLERLPDILKMDEKGRWLKPKRRALFERLEPQGNVRAEVRLKGLIFGEAPLDMTGSLQASGLEYDLDSSEAKGTVKIRNARMAMLPDRVVIDKLLGSFNTIEVKTSGTLFGDRCELGLVTSGDLGTYRMAIPRSLHDSREASGPVRISGWARGVLANASGTATPVDFIRALTNGESHRVAWDYQLAIDARDCAYTYATMPVGASNITGRLYVEPNKLYTDGFLRSQWGTSGMGVTSGTLQVKPLAKPDPATPWKTKKVHIRYAGNFPRVLVDEWLTGWMPRPSSLASTRTVVRNQEIAFPAQSQSTLAKLLLIEDVLIEGTIKADKVLWKDFQFQQVSTRLLYHHYTSTYPAFLEFRNLRGRAYGGEAASDLAFLLRKPQPEWNWRIAARNVEVKDFLAAWMEKAPSLSGKASGNLSLVARNADKQTYRGQGEAHLRDGSFSGNPLFSELGRLLSVEGMENTSFNTIDGLFVVAGGKVQSPGISLKSTLLDLVASGQADLETKGLEFDVVYKFFGPLDKIPFVGRLTNFISSATGTILKMRVGGTIGAPSIAFLPSLDDLNVFKERANIPKSVKKFPCPLLPLEEAKL